MYIMNGIKFLGISLVDFRVRLTKFIKLGPEFIGLLLEIDKHAMSSSVIGSLRFGDVNKHTENCHTNYIKESKMASEKCTMSQELKRVATFKDYPDGDTPSVITLARGGFMYVGTGFRVKCPSCGMEVEKFRQDDNPLEEHKRQSPNCPLVALASTSNSSSLSSVVSSSEVARCSSPAMQQIYNSSLRRSSERMTNANDPGEDGNNESKIPPNRVDRNDPDYELLRCEQTRLATFYDWPATANVHPEELAREGLFYTGSADRVRCAFCRNALRKWEPGDIPRDEHKKYFPNCPFVQIREAEIENASKQRNCTPNPVSTASSSSTSANSVQNAVPVNHSGNSGTTGSVDAFMSTPTVRAVLDMGFSPVVVKQTIQHHLNETGELFQNAETLLENLLFHGYKMSSIPVGAEANATPVVMPNVIEPCASSSMQAVQQNAVHDPATQEIVGNKKRKVKKKKKGASTNKTLSITGSGAAKFEATNSISNSNTSPSKSTAAAVNDAQGEAEVVEENSGMLLDLEEQELMEENTRLREARTCKVCMDKEVDTVFLPCGHLICCSTCSPKVHNCPLCRTFIRGTVKTYLS